MHLTQSKTLLTCPTTCKLQNMFTNCSSQSVSHTIYNKKNIPPVLSLRQTSTLSFRIEIEKTSFHQSSSFIRPIKWCVTSWSFTQENSGNTPNLPFPKILHNFSTYKYCIKEVLIRSSQVVKLKAYKGILASLTDPVCFSFKVNRNNLVFSLFRLFNINNNEMNRVDNNEIPITKTKLSTFS